VINHPSYFDIRASKIAFGNAGASLPRGIEASINSCGKASEWPSALWLLEELNASAQVQADVISYSVPLVAKRDWVFVCLFVFGEFIQKWGGDEPMSN